MVNRLSASAHLSCDSPAEKSIKSVRPALFIVSYVWCTFAICGVVTACISILAVCNNSLLVLHGLKEFGFGHNMVLGKESQQTQDLPIFVPPRKRQASKKSNGHHNYVDHIVNVQVTLCFLNFFTRHVCIPFHIIHAESQQTGTDIAHYQ